jgi:tripartite-type tricarboxylate transporter receptor subunit TctC
MNPSEVRRTMLRALALLAASGATGRAGADAYPSRAITLIVPFAPGGFNDISARIIARKLAENLGRSVIVENRAGAAGAIGASAVARAASDGYTLGFLSSGPLASNVSLYRQLPYDPVKDFAHISRATSTANALVVGPSLTANNLDELVSYLKQNPDKVNYGSSGSGSTPHLSAVLFESMAGVRMTHVPYRGGSQTNVALQSGEIQLAFSPILELMPLIQAGKVRPLAVTSTGRSAQLPEVPALSEKLPGYEVLIWNGLVAPAGTPHAIVDRLNAEVSKVLESADVKANLNELALTPAPMAPEAFTAYVRTEIGAFAKLVKMAGVEPE